MLPAVSGKPVHSGKQRKRLPQWVQWIVRPLAAVASLARGIRGYSTPTNLRLMLPELAAIVGFLALLWASIIIAINHEHYTAETAADRSTSNLALAFEESTRRTISQIDQILLSARAFYAVEGTHFNFDKWARTQTLPDKMTAQIGMADTTGLVFADTLPIPHGVRITDRPHFRAQLDPTHDNLYISRPVHGRVSKQDTIQFTRKLLGPDGEFAGVTVFSLGCVELSRFYQMVDLGKGFVALLLADGTVLARGPLVPGLIGSRITDNPALHDVLTQGNGTIRFHGNWSHIDLIASFRHLQDYPLIVMVGLDSNTVFQQYWSLRRRMVLTGLAVTLAISVIGMLWLRQKRRSVESRRALAVTLETISQGILMVDAHGHVPVMNVRAQKLLDLPGVESKAGRQAAVARASELAARDVPASERTIAASEDEVANEPIRDSRFDVARDDGQIIEVRSHKLADGGVVQTYTDVTDQRLAEARVRYLAHYDVLTGLANRAQLRQRIPEILGRRTGTTQLTAFIMIDLDGFKDINDTLGHDAGDELLVECGRRLQALTSDTGVVTRLGGDEFVILQPGLRRPEDATEIVQRILQQLADPAQLRGQQVRIGASIGIAFYPQDGEDGETLLKHADIALYSAKAQGRGTYRCFSTKMIDRVNDLRLLESDLRRALDDHELEVHFQPEFSCGDLNIVGFEALARWRHPIRGYISPDTFVRIAEGAGLINQLGHWVMEQACAAAAAWQPPYPVAVNVSTLQLRDERLVDDIAAILTRTGLPAERLEIEVTESILADDNQPVLGTLHTLKQMGIRITLDDFGTGYSSLSYLRRFSFEKIKIDKSFVQGQVHDPSVQVILEAILSMCQKLGLAVVGEGVETHQQLAMLRRHNCAEVQGYLLARPMPIDLVEEFIWNHLHGVGHGSTSAPRPEQLTPAF